MHKDRNQDSKGRRRCCDFNNPEMFVVNVLKHFILGSSSMSFSSISFSLFFLQASQVALAVKNPLANVADARDPGSIPGLGRSLEKEMATHSTGSLNPKCSCIL